jgi:hypothetical protein
VKRRLFFFSRIFQDKVLGKNVRIGRKKELKENGWIGEPSDPQKPSTFVRSKLNWQERSKGKGRKMLEYYQNLIELRKTFVNSDPNKYLKIRFNVSKDGTLLVIQKKTSDSILITVANFGKKEGSYTFPCSGGLYRKVLDSADVAWFGPGSLLPEKANLGDRHIICPLSLAVFCKSEGEK